MPLAILPTRLQLLEMAYKLNMQVLSGQIILRPHLNTPSMIPIAKNMRHKTTCQYGPGQCFNKHFHLVKAGIKEAAVTNPKIINPKPTAIPSAIKYDILPPIMLQKIPIIAHKIPTAP